MIGDLFERIYDPENLFISYKRARKGLKIKNEANTFEERLEYNIFEISALIKFQRYEFGPYQRFTVWDPKERQIYVAPFVDRIVHHAINDVIEPIIERSFINDSYACRKNRGNLKAVKRLQSWINGEPSCYVLKLDVQKYFGSIDRDILFRQLSQRIFHEDVLKTLRRLIMTAPSLFDDGRGLPIGNLTSQTFANLYLSDFDHYIKDWLGIRRYLRYVDDSICVVSSKQEAHRLRKDLAVFLEKNLNLNISKGKDKVLAARNGVTFLGFVLKPNFRPKVKRKAVQRFFWKIRRAIKRGASEFEIAEKVVSWSAYANIADVGPLLRGKDLERYLAKI